MVVYDYSPEPSPGFSLSAAARGKEFEKVKKVNPELIKIAKNMFPNNSKLIYLTGAFLFTAIVLEARYLQDINAPEDIIQKQILAQFEDVQVQELISYAKDCGEFLDIVEMIETKNTSAIMEDAEQLFNS